jgi:hypothetical protein
MKRFLALVLLVVFAFPLDIVAQEQARLLRFPTIHENQVVFTYAGNMYIVSATGGLARRLTNHEGFEMFPRYDVEGRQWIMEGHGVEPDIVVDNDPAKEFAGVDEQLNKAIGVILEALKTGEKTIPPPPSYPAKN